MKTTLAILALGLFAATAAAQTVTVRDETGQETTSQTEVAPNDETAVEPAKPQNARTCLTLTGSRVTANRNLRAAREGRSERECANGVGRVYSEDDIERTGQRSVADALRSLDTGIR